MASLVVAALPLCGKGMTVFPLQWEIVVSSRLEENETTNTAGWLWAGEVNVVQIESSGISLCYVV